MDKRDGSSKRRARIKAARRRTRAKNALVYPSVSYSSSRLVTAAIALRGLGARPSAVKRAYVPFMVEGQGSWADTWGAPRFGPGDRVRKHEGQDVFCFEGAPVLAIDAGWIEFDSDTLGGLVARLHTADGRYFYYAHLSGWNSAELSSGDPVEPGDEIGYCGNSGNAEGTSPHVHFGWYDAAGGDARNPHSKLVENLLAAERVSAQMLDQMQHRVARDAPLLRTHRLFGEGFLTELSELAGCSRIQARNMLVSRLMIDPLAPLFTLDAG
jgi:murein DD-endopeptidase MepM/ murein hydrolase activator NlpD